eukprot:3701470-Amphidinium_carterae.1
MFSLCTVLNRTTLALGDVQKELVCARMVHKIETRLFAISSFVRVWEVSVSSFCGDGSSFCGDGGLCLGGSWVWKANLFGIQVINEPDESLDAPLLDKYYSAAILAAREFLPKEIPDSQRAMVSEQITKLVKRCPQGIGYSNDEDYSTTLTHHEVGLVGNGLGIGDQAALS